MQNMPMAADPIQLIHQDHSLRRTFIAHGAAFSQALDAATKLDRDGATSRRIWTSRDPGAAIMEWFWDQRG